MNMSSQKGFTLIELVLVIAILGILSISALPRFMSLATDAENASKDGVLGAVRSAVVMSRAESMINDGGDGVFPATLDAEAAGECANCFSSILSSGISDPSWQKIDNQTYSFYDGTGAVNYEYDSATGTFVEAAAAP